MTDMSKSETLTDGVLWRAASSLGAVEGRTLSGIAMPFDVAQRVQDLSGPAYNEAFSPGAFDVSIRDHGATRDFFVRHDYMQDPIGAVTFQRSAEGLMFDALVSKTQRGDEYLELCCDGAMRSVSVGFIPVPGKTFTRSVAGTNAQYRTEAILKELSLTPTGFGQYPQSQVLAIRDALEHDAEELEASRTLRSAELARFARMGHRLGIALGEKTPAETV